MFLFMSEMKVNPWILGLVGALALGAIGTAARSVLQVERLEVRTEQLERAAVPLADMPRQLGRIEATLEILQREVAAIRLQSQPITRR